MNIAPIALLALVFAFGAAVAYLVASRLLPTPTRQRVTALAHETASAGTPPAPLGGAVGRWLQRLARWSVPEQAWDKSPLRIRFYNAGFRSASAPMVYFASKTALTFALPALLGLYIGFGGRPFAAPMLLTLLLAGATLGYYLPNAVLAHLVKRRQRELFEAFPDALDLMRVCIEAGLGLDAAIERVGREMALESKVLSEEFQLVSLELRAGASRQDALRNLSLRVALEDIDAMVAMLVQAERFGTSIAESLRVHSLALRNKRRLIAEEAAAKLPVKLLVPLVFCIFPALLTVLLGPAVVSVSRTLLPAMRGG